MTDLKIPTDTPSILSKLLPHFGVKKVFVSPGSRNATIIDALVQNKELNAEMVVDERSAAFIALGYASTSGEPVCVVCTSGTAPLNYAPAVAEAYYRHIPLIVVSADRPAEWINQDDSQTIIQPGIYKGYVKSSFDIPVLKDEESVWFANRTINEALTTALNGLNGPVHLNIQIADRPEKIMAPAQLVNRRIESVGPRRDMPVSECRQLAATIASPRKVMIIAGFMAPSSKLNRALSRLAAFDNIVILTETTANLHNNMFIGSIDRTLKAMPEEETERYRPDVVITLGGALISRRIKSFLRKYTPEEHWYVGTSDTVIDIMRSLTRIVRMEPAIFFEQFAAAMQPHRRPSDYSRDWHILSDKGLSVLQSVAANAGWSDLKAFATLIPAIPRRWNVHYSNGTPIRYAQLFGDRDYHRCDCNRGVSGIDGCTSTAIGASIAYKDVTLLVTGDMSALYDISAFAAALTPSRFKIILINNGGGGIFRFINATKHLAVRDEYLYGNIHIPAEELCRGFGYHYFKASDEPTLRAELRKFISDSETPSLLEIVTPAGISADILDKLLN